MDGIEALCVFLKRFSYPCRYADMVPKFARPIPQLSMISDEVTNFIYTHNNHLLRIFTQPWLSQANLKQFDDAVHNKGPALQNCWGFVDGTVRPVCRPGKNQRTLYNGHKRVHALKFQSVGNGLIANLYGPVEGKRHDSGMRAESGLLNELQQHSFAPNGNPLCIYGDPTYTLRVHPQAPFKGANLRPLEKEFNKSMSQVSTSVEWIFGDITNYFAFLDFKKDLKVCLSAVGKMYSVCALLTNACTCLYMSLTSSYFNLDQPELEQYF